MKNEIKKIYCIGDSHVSFFCGKDVICSRKGKIEADNFIIYRIGSVLAYHLCSKKSSTNGRNKLFGILDSIPKNSRIILSFGEIDCRCHLIRISDIKHKPLEDIVKKCVNRYVRVIREIKNMGFDIIIWNVLPSSLEDKCEDNANIYSYYGSNKKRNDTAKMFNDTLKNNIPTGVLLLDIFDKLVDKNGNTKKEYFWDGIHLSQKAMPLVERMLK